MIQIKVKITKAEFIEGQNKYGEAYTGYNCVGIETDVPEGTWANKVAFFVKGTTVAVGDVGTVNVNLDIRQYNNRDFVDARISNWQCLTPGTF